MSNLSLFWNLGEEEARPLYRHHRACPTGSCRIGGRAWRPSKPPELWEKDEDGEENKEDDVDEEEIQGKRRDEKDIQDSLVVKEGMIVKIPKIPVATFAAPASRFLSARRS